MSRDASQPTSDSAAPPAGVAACVLTILGAVLLRLTVGYDPLPGWSADPTVVFTPETTIGPTLSIVIDLVIVAASCELAARVRAERIGLMAATALAAGLVGVLTAAGPAGVAIGTSWAAALAAAVALSAACAVPRTRPLVAAALLAGLVTLALKSGLQVFVEHPRTLRTFAENRDAFLAAQGWTDGSASARAFERRLTQPEASAWFGLANVLGTVGAGILAIALGLAVHGRGAGRAARILLGVAAVLAAVLVLLSGGKGAFTAGMLAIGLTCAPLVMRARLTPRLGAVVALACVLGALAAVAARGQIGERLSELSLLFRWFYMQTAARVFAENPLLGVGPDGFKDAYMRLKPAISPEEVTSPHSVLFDYAATLGLAGLAAGVMLLVLTARVGRAWTRNGAIHDQSEHAAESARTIVRGVGLISAVVMLLTIHVERAIMTPELAAIRLLGVIGAMAFARAVSRVPARAIPAALGAAAIVVMTHGQIEVSPVWIGSAAFVLACLGAAAGSRSDLPLAASESTPRADRWRAWLPRALGATLILAAAALHPLPTIRTWERSLSTAARSIGEITDLRIRLDAVRSGRPVLRGDSRETIAAELSAITGQPVLPAPQTLNLAIGSTLADRIDAAITSLNDAQAALARRGLDSPETRNAAARLLIALAAMQRDLPGAAGQRNALADAVTLAAQPPKQSATDLGDHAALLRGLHAITGDSTYLQRAIASFEAAAAFDPHGLTYPLAAFKVAEELGDIPLARAWADRCLAIDRNMRLDPLRGLDAATRDRMRALSGQSGT